MTKSFTFALICSLLLGFISSSKGQPISNLQRTRIEQQVDSVFHNNLKAAEHFDYDQLSQSVDDKYKAGFIWNNIFYARYDSLINIVKTRSQGVSKQTMTIQKEKITVISEQIVLLTAIGVTNVELNNGTTISANFFWSFVYEKTGKNWKVIQSHQSSVR